ncbi:MAG TPA: polyhydroxyalkanoate depolymerase [Acetobacteraceae bacterium]|nr:polyhydroxyalkanoate depolymerase [Acetobacteraceae bacterium]
MLYQYYEWQRASLEPMRVFASGALHLLDLPGNPFRDTPIGRWTAATLDHFEHNTQYFAKPSFGHTHTFIDGEKVAVTEEVLERRVWCDLLHFHRALPRPHDPRVLLVAPMSGHFATLLRGTVATFLPDHDVYITDWTNARDVPISGEDFDLDDYIDHVIGFMRRLGPNLHVIAVCQPAVPVLAATALMNAANDPAAPRSITLIGGPIDTREAPTEVNQFAKRHSLDWFRRNVIHPVPFGNVGFLRQVYPGFVQLAGFMAMNLDRHFEAHWQMFLHLVDGDGESLASKREFYQEYKAVMDMPADYYLQTIAAVFQEHLLPRGLLVSRERPVSCAAITRSALLTIEGERDDISGIGQTRAAHTLCTNLPPSMRHHIEQPGVGHYGLFNGSRFREAIAPQIKSFIRAHAA